MNTTITATAESSITTKPRIKEKASLQAWVVCLVAATFFFYEYIQMNMFNAISQQLMTAFNLDGAQLGNLSAAYFYANLVFLIPAGLILDRFSTRKVMLTALVICILGTVGFALTTSYHLGLIYRFFTGIAGAFCFLSCIRLATRWFPSHRIALITGLIVTMAMTGGTIAQTPMTLLTQATSWRDALLVDAVIGVVFAILIWFIVKDFPDDKTEHFEQAQIQARNIGFWRSLIRSYLKLQNWLGGFYTSLMNLPISLLGALWGGMFLQQVHHFNADQASYITSMIFVGTIIGSPTAGWLSDKIGYRKLPMLVGAVISLAIVAAIIYLPHHSISSLMLLFFALGFFTSTQVIGYPIVAESNSPILTATSVSVVSFTTIGGYAVFQPFFGWLMDLHWNHQVVHGHPFYSAQDYHLAMLIMPIGFIVAIVATLLMRETRCQPIRE